jgi:aminoglycoside/choline kinase family phosphotransferase
VHLPPDDFLVPLRNPGIIDFQGALHGPLAYDLASLLRDCYIGWDDGRVTRWVESYRVRAVSAGLLDAAVDAVRFRRWFDLIGLQRHIKVLGIFCRLWYRDGKPGYLADLPRVLGYVLDVARRYPELAGLAALIERCVGGRDVTAPASA